MVQIQPKIQRIENERNRDMLSLQSDF